LTGKIRQEILQVIYTWFREHGGEWPNFDNIDRRLNRHRDEQLDTAGIMKRIPNNFLRPLNYIDGEPDPEGEVALRIEGVARCLGSDDDTHNFIAALRWLVQQYRSYDPPQGSVGSEMQISAEQLATELRLPLNSDSNCIRRLVALLKAEGLVSSGEHT
jgi:hypothetical protein